MSVEPSKLWQGRISSPSHQLLESFNNSLAFDRRLWQVDLMGSLVHAEMLAHQGVIGEEDYQYIKVGFSEIIAEIQPDPERWFQDRSEFEDIHSALETVLTEKIGEAGRRLHTARSRNDQVVTDLKLWLRFENYRISELLIVLLETLLDLAERDMAIPLPGYTHLQRAQPISLGHHWLAHFARFERDLGRMTAFRAHLKAFCPLGSGALAGTTFPIDRGFTATQLGFESCSRNSLDSVSDRDFAAEHHFASALIGIHLSQLAEEVILWTSDEFHFFELDDRFATGSSMMPQKKNPDIPELLRGKSARLIGHLQSIMVLLKGLPLAYNKDLQEDKEPLFDACDHLKLSLEILSPFLSSLKVCHDYMYNAVQTSFMNATDAADYLVRRGIPFREAYTVTGRIVQHCLKEKIFLSDLKLADWQTFHIAFQDDIERAISVEQSLAGRNSFGGTAISQVQKQLVYYKERLYQSSLKLQHEQGSDRAVQIFDLLFLRKD